MFDPDFLAAYPTFSDDPSEQDEEVGKFWQGIWRKAKEAPLARIAELEAERDALKVDAERYRYWRSASMDERNRLEHYAESALDIAIDAAIKDQPKEGQ